MGTKGFQIVTWELRAGSLDSVNRFFNAFGSVNHLYQL